MRIYCGLAVFGTVLTSCDGKVAGPRHRPEGPPVPGVTVLPVSGSRIRIDRSIVITFTEPMDPASLVLGGVMASSAGPGVFDSAARPDDRLTLLPRTTWPEAGLDLSVRISTAAGEGLPVLNLFYQVDDSVPSGNFSPFQNVIGTEQVIALQLNETIARASVVATGTIGSDATLAFGTTASTDDRIEFLPPANGWTPGAGQLLQVDLADLVGLTNTLSITYTVDLALPSYEVRPQHMSEIQPNVPIVVEFSKTMNTATLQVQGTLGAASNGGAWSNTRVADDTLTLSPATLWPLDYGDLRISVSDAQGNWVQVTFVYRVDGYTATFELAPNRATLLSTDDLIFTFSEAMDPASLRLSGELAASAATPLWTSQLYANDRLVVSPLSSWPTGVRSLGVAVADPAGNTANPLLTFCIVDHVLYVRTAADGGDDAAGGCDGRPLASLAAAYMRVATLYWTDPVEIRMAAGTFEVSGLLFEGEQPRVLRCGYDASDWSRLDPAPTGGAFETRIVDPRANLTGGSPILGNAPLTISASAPTTIEGCTFVAPGGDHVAGLAVFSVLGGDVVLVGNAATATGGSEGNVGIRLFNYTPTWTARVVGNVLRVAGGASYAWGIGVGIGNDNSDGDVFVRDNDIEVVGGPEAVGIDARTYVAGGRYDLTIEGNRVVATADGTASGIQIANSGSIASVPIVIARNVLEVRSTGVGQYTTGVEANGLGDIFDNVVRVDGGFSRGITQGGVGALPTPSSRYLGNTIVVDATHVASGLAPAIPGVVIEHNLVVVRSTNTGTSAFGLYESSSDAKPYSVRFNDLVAQVPYSNVQGGCADPADSNPSACSIAEMESLPFAGGAVGNVSIEPFLDATHRLPADGSASCAVARSAATATDVAAYGFASDAASAPRTVPWSIGAYELDGACAP